MDPELLRLQLRAHAAAAEFARAQGAYWMIHSHVRQNDQMRAAAQECRETGGQYGLALKTLLNYLETPGVGVLRRQEITQTKRLMSSLNGEVQFFAIE